MGILSWFFRLSPENPGVYRIRNKSNGRAYIGSGARSIAIRWEDHRFRLNKCIHPNKALQQDWTACGKRAFVFEVLEIVRDRRIILDREAFWQKQERDPYSNAWITPHAHRGQSEIVEIEATQQTREAAAIRGYTPRKNRRHDLTYYPAGVVQISNRMPPEAILFLMAMLCYADGEYASSPDKIAALLKGQLSQEHVLSLVTYHRSQWRFNCSTLRYEPLDD